MVAPSERMGGESDNLINIPYFCLVTQFMYFVKQMISTCFVIDVIRFKLIIKNF